MAGESMTKKQWDLKRYAEQGILLEQLSEEMTEHEKDIWNLKWLKTSIGYQSNLFRSGCYSSLQRAISIMERDISG